MNKFQDLTGIRRQPSRTYGPQEVVLESANVGVYGGAAASPVESPPAGAHYVSSVKENDAPVKSVLFERIPYYLLIGLTFLLPVFVLPGSTAGFGLVKMLVFALGVVGAFAFWVIDALRNGVVRLPNTWLMIGALGLPIAFLVSAFFTDVPSMSIFGIGFEPGTVFFIGIGAVAFMLASSVFQSRSRIFTFYMALLASFAVTALFQFSRFLFGYDFLSFDMFTTSIANLLGKWNDLAIFAGLAVLTSVIALEILPSKGSPRTALYALLVAGLGMMAVVNFVLAWIVLAIFLVLFAGVAMRSQNEDGARETSGGSADTKRRVPTMALTVVAIAALFAIAGQPIGERIAQSLDISHLEARPSFGSTMNIARDTFEGTEATLFGVGPNQFIRSWLVAKPDELNLTPFWNVDFAFGVGLLPTFAITAGVVGMIAWVIFLGGFTKAGIGAMLERREDQSWRFIVLASVLGSLFLWAFSLTYVPNGVLFALTFLMSGVAVAAILRVRGHGLAALPFGESKFGFVTSLMLIVFLGGSVWGGYVTTRRFAAASNFGTAAQALSSGDTDAALVAATAAVNKAPLDRNYRLLSQIELEHLREIVAQSNEAGSSDALRDQFRTTLEGAVEHARLAAEIDPFNYENWAMRASVYGLLVPLGVEGAYDNAESAYQRAIELNPKNPALHLARARVALSGGDVEKAREFVGEAIKQKSNYSEAIFFLSQLEVQAGDIEAAKKSAEAAVALQPSDPMIYFQLGLLRYSDEEFEGAGAALEQAVALKSDYANARYFLGLVYDKLGHKDEAIAQFVEIEKTNQDNNEVKQILSNLRGGRSAFAGATASENIEPPEDREKLPIDEEEEGAD